MREKQFVTTRSKVMYKYTQDSRREVFCLWPKVHRGRTTLNDVFLIFALFIISMSFVFKFKMQSICNY